MEKKCVLPTGAGEAVLLLMMQNYMFQLLLYRRKIINILLNNKIKDFKDLFIGSNIKQKK